MNRKHLVIAVVMSTLLLGLLAGSPTRAQEDAAPSLYERLGGVYAIALVVDDLIDRVAGNEVLNANPNVYAARVPARFPGLKFQLTAMVCQATGGPCNYTGKSMEEAHAGMQITEAEWQALVDDFQASLDGFNVPAAEQQELMAIVATTKAAIVTGGSDGGE